MNPDPQRYAARPGGALPARHSWNPLTGLTALVLVLPILGQPTITSEPADQSVSLNVTVQFRVTTQTSAGPMAFRWWFKDAPLDNALLPSAGTSRLLLTNVTEAMAGAYWVVVTDNNGSVTSRVAQLEVDPTFSKIVHGSPVTDLEGSVTATWIDYDQDGYLDLFVGNLGIGGSQVPNALYHNRQDGTFSKVLTNAVATARMDAWGIAWGDYDNDGKPDLFVAQPLGRSDFLFRNLGGGAFAQVKNSPLTTDQLDSIMPLWGDYDLDGYLDLFLATGYWSGPQNDRLYHNEGGLQFRPMSASEVGDAVEDNARSMSPSWIDYDGDGDLDLFTANVSLFTTANQATNYVFENTFKGPMIRRALPDLDPPGVVQGLAWGDFNNDGYPDLFMPAFLGTNALFQNQNGEGFLNVSETAGLKLAMASNASAWGDFDNDGWLDLFVGNYGDPSYADFPGGHALFRNRQDGTFARITSGSLAHDGGRACGAAWGDYDNDGFLDLYVACGDGVAEPNLLYRNSGNGNHWLKVRLQGSASNRLGVGAKVRVLATIGGQAVWQLRTISGQHSWVSGDGLLAHFGLGDATVAEVVRVEWPSGNVQELTNQPGDRVITITEPTRIQPLHPSASLGGAVTLTNMTGGSYQWSFDGVELAGQTNRTLSVTNLQAAQQGRYGVVVTAASGTTTTNYTYLLVDTQFTKITEGPIVQDTGNSWNCSWADYDRDGDADLFVVRHLTGTNGLYRNDGGGSFTRMSDTPFTQAADRWSGGPWGDYDNDGYPDLYVGGFDLRGGAGMPGHFYHNAGDGTFTEAAVAEPQQAWCASWADYDQDGYLDLFIPNWGEKFPYLFHNRGDGTFVRATTDQAGSLLASHAASCAAAWADYDDDGLLDVCVGAVNGSERSHLLFRNTGAGYFTRVTNQVLVKSGATILAGVWGDYDNDRRLDLFVANWGGKPNSLYQNIGGGQFREVLDAPVVSQAGSFNSGAWGDYDNDGFLDLFVTHAYSTNLLYHNNGDGGFTRVTTGSPITDLASTGPLDGPVAGLWWDYNNDGFLDLFVANGSDDFSHGSMSNFLYRNNGNANAWLKIKLEGTVSNRDGAGAKVRVKARFAGQVRWQRRDTSAGDNYNGNNLIAHFGLGDAVKADLIRIVWPSGIVQELTDVAANQVLTVTEPVALEALGEGRIRILCWKHQNYEVEVSDDLDHWTSLGVVATDVNRPVVMDPGAVGHPHRFYRAKRQ